MEEFLKVVAILLWGKIFEYLVHRFEGFQKDWLRRSGKVIVIVKVAEQPAL